MVVVSVRETNCATAYAEQLASDDARQVMVGIALSYVALAQMADRRGVERRR
jgi:hypothetical protein